MTDQIEKTINQMENDNANNKHTTSSEKISNLINHEVIEYPHNIRRLKFKSTIHGNLYYSKAIRSQDTKLNMRNNNLNRRNLNEKRIITNTQKTRNLKEINWLM